MKYLLTLFLAASLAAPALAQDEAFTGKVFTAKGVVEYQKAGTNDWLSIKAPYNIEAGDKVRTGPGSKAEVYVKYGSKVRLEPGTTFLLDKVSKEDNTMTVLVGKMQAWMRKLVNRKFTVRTPTAVCAVRGTTFEVEVAETGETVWNLFTGIIQVADSSNRSVELTAGQRVAVTPDAGVAAPEPLPAEVKAPSEPPKTKEEKEEIKAEKQEIKAQEQETKKAEAEAKAKAAAEAKLKAETDAKAKAEAEAKAKAEAAAKGEAPKDAPAVTEEPAAPPAAPVEPETSVLPTQTVQESCGLSSSTPGCIP